MLKLTCYMNIYQAFIQNTRLIINNVTLCSPKPLKRIIKIAADVPLFFYFSLKNNEDIFMNVDCCSCNWRFKG